MSVKGVGSILIVCSSSDRSLRNVGINSNAKIKLNNKIYGKIVISHTVAMAAPAILRPFASQFVFVLPGSNGGIADQS